MVFKKKWLQQYFASYALFQDLSTPTPRVELRVRVNFTQAVVERNPDLGTAKVLPNGCQGCYGEVTSGCLHLNKSVYGSSVSVPSWYIGCVKGVNKSLWKSWVLRSRETSPGQLDLRIFIQGASFCCVSGAFMSLRWLSRSWMPGLYSRCMFNFRRNLTS